VQGEVRTAWLELAYLQRAVETVNRHLSLALQTEEVTRSAYESGGGSYADVLTAQIEVGRIDVKLAGLRDQLVPAAVRLNTAAGLDPETPTPARVDLEAAPVGQDLPDRVHLESLLEAHSPELAALRAAQESRRQVVELAGKAAYPDLTLGLDYIMTGPARIEGVTDSGQDPVIARVAVNLPLWGGQADAAQKKSAGLMRAAGADLADARLRLRSRLEAVTFALRESERQERLYADTMISRGRQALEVTTAGYAAGRAAFQDLVSSRRTLLELELASLRAATDRRLAFSDLITLLGVDPTAAPQKDG
jgi:outer membrane protein TolC